MEIFNIIKNTKSKLISVQACDESASEYQSWITLIVQFEDKVYDGKNFLSSYII